jgi:hypothetical protein
MALSEDLSAVRETVTDISVTVGRIEEQGKATCERVGDLETAVFGNGRPGLMADMGEVKGRVNILWTVFCRLLPYMTIGGASYLLAGGKLPW